MRISDWSSDVCSSDLVDSTAGGLHDRRGVADNEGTDGGADDDHRLERLPQHRDLAAHGGIAAERAGDNDQDTDNQPHGAPTRGTTARSEERRGGKAWFSTFKTRWSPKH